MINLQFLLRGAAVAAFLCYHPLTMAEDPIRVGSIHDTSGIFGHYGRSMDMAITLAIEEINDDGGLIDRPVRKIAYDTQSKAPLYSEFTEQLIADGVDVVHGAILSSDREVIRQQLRNADIPYFYNTQYEGGVCDRNAFFTGVTPAQQAQILMPEVIKRWGKKIFVVAADYNYGRITSNWVEFFARKNDAEVVATEYFALNVDNFNATIARIKEVEPDFVVSILVGGAHLSFYRQWASSGLKGEIPIASTTMGAGNEQIALTKEEVDGMMMVYSYSKELGTADNQAFLKKWKNRFGDTDGIHELAVATYQGMHIWAEGVRKAGTLDREQLLESLESGVRIDAPTGAFSLDPKTHHAVTSVHLVEVKDQKMQVISSYDELQPLDTQIVCNLVVQPDVDEQFSISVELYDVMFPSIR